MTLQATCSAFLLVAALVFSGCGNSVSQANKLPPDVAKIIDAIDKGDTSRLKSLLEAGAEPTPRNSPLSPLHAAITHFHDGQLMCNSVALKLLLENGADPNFVDQDSGFAPLEDGLQMGDIECAKALKHAGARIDSPDPKKPSILDSAVMGAVRTNDTRVLELALSWGIDPNKQSRGRSGTPLHEAVFWKKDQVVDELLRNGVDPCIADASGQTPLDMAINLKRSKSIQRLLTDAMRACPKHEP